MEYLHTMIRVSDLDASLAFFVGKIGLVEVRRVSNEKGRYTLVFLAAPGDAETRGEEPGAAGRTDLQLGPGSLRGRAQFRPSRLCRRRHLRDLCQRMQKAGVDINRPPRDGRMAFIRSPDAISIELFQKGAGAVAGRALGVDGQCRRLVSARDAQTIAALTRLRNSLAEIVDDGRAPAPSGSRTARRAAKPRTPCRLCRPRNTRRRAQRRRDAELERAPRSRARSHGPASRNGLL